MYTESDAAPSTSVAAQCLPFDPCFTEAMHSDIPTYSRLGVTSPGGTASSVCALMLEALSNTL